MYSLWCNWQYGSIGYTNIGSDNDLSSVQRQAIIWTNVGMFYRCIYVSLGLNELTAVWCHSNKKKQRSKAKFFTLCQFVNY